MPRLSIVAVFGLIVSLGCSQPEEPIRPDLAKAPAGPSVTAADPSFGRRGDVGLAVTILGSGFDQGSQASWELGGTTDPKVVVRSTQFVTSSELLATIDIQSNATLSLYDVAVTTGLGRKGIGTAKFEVTQAQPIAGTESAFGVNQGGEVAGRLGPVGAFYWSAGSGLVTLGTPGRAFDISEDGRTVAGFTGVCCAGGFVHVNAGGGWQFTVLPRDPAATSHAAQAVASDPVTGAAVVVGGFELYPAKGNNLNRKPRLWYPDGAGGWTRVALPAPGGTTDSPLFDVNAAGMAVGSVGGRAAIWSPNGPAVWTQATIGGSGSGARAINAAGTLAVGFVAAGGGTAAQYWTVSGGSWTGHGLPGGCTEAVDVDGGGRILANGCANGNRNTPAVIFPPYSAGDVRLLGALGQTGTTSASRMSAGGAWIVGQAEYKSGSVGVRWTLGVP